MAEWLRVLVLQSGGPGFKSSTLPLAGLFFSVVPSSNPRSRFVNSQLVCLLSVGIFLTVLRLFKYLFPLFQWHACKLANA